MSIIDKMDTYIIEDKIKGIAFPIVFTVNGEPVGVANNRSQYYTLVKKFHTKSDDDTSVTQLDYWYDKQGWKKDKKKMVDAFVAKRNK